MKFTKYFFICFLLMHSVSFGQTDTIFNDDNYRVKLRLAGGQIETVVYYVLLGFGGFADLDLLSKRSSNDNTFGLRFALEYYSYFDEYDGSPFDDYCLYGRYTNRIGDFWISFLGGLSYHHYNHFFDDEILFRAGLEFKYNLLGKYAGLLLKGSSSFQEQTTYFGLGIFFGYFE